MTENTEQNTQTSDNSRQSAPAAVDPTGQFSFDCRHREFYDVFFSLTQFKNFGRSSKVLQLHHDNIENQMFLMNYYEFELNEFFITPDNNAHKKSSAAGGSSQNNNTGQQSDLLAQEN